MINEEAHAGGIRGIQRQAAHGGRFKKRAGFPEAQVSRESLHWHQVQAEVHSTEKAVGGGDGELDARVEELFVIRGIVATLLPVFEAGAAKLPELLLHTVGEAILQFWLQRHGSCSRERA